MGTENCVSKTPWLSIIATIICCIGVGLFCGTLYRALDLTIDGIFLGLFLFRVPWLESIQIVFLMAAIVVGCYVAMLLIFGLLATSATRSNIYAGAKCIMGGRISAAFFLLMSYLLNCTWLGVSCVCAMPIIICYMLNNICDYEIRSHAFWHYESYCLNLSRFGIYRNYSEGVDKNALCEETELTLFCDIIGTATPMYGLAFGGSLLMVLGLSVFLIILTCNYVKIMTAKEVTDYRDVLAIDDRVGTTY